MPITRIQTSLQCDSGLPRDQFVNSIHVDSVAATDAQLFAWSSAIITFYNAISQYLSPLVAATGHTSKFYTVGAPLETPPRYTRPFEITPPAGSGLPLEVASCLSMKANPRPGYQLQSTRGRIYIGPLNTTSVGQDVVNGSQPSLAFRNAVTAAAAALFVQMRNDGGVWGVYSKVHNAISPLVQVSMNDEWDTQRSRGLRATTKTIENLPVVA